MTKDTDILKAIRESDNVCMLFGKNDNSPSKAVSDWKKNLEEELELLTQGIYEDFDFEGKIESSVIKQTKKLIDKLPLLIFSPDLGINDDGTLLLEWARRENDGSMTMFSIILNNSEIITSLMHYGNIKHYNAGLHSEYSVQMVENILNEYFEKPINTKISTAR